MKYSLNPELAGAYGNCVGLDPSLENAASAADLVRIAAKQAHMLKLKPIGFILGDNYLVVYSKLEWDNMAARDRFSQRLVKLGREELAVGVWPRKNPHTWAVLLRGNADPHRMVYEALVAWVTQNVHKLNEQYPGDKPAKRARA